MDTNLFYEELEHTADWAIRVWGETLVDLFEHAALAMFELQGAQMRAQTFVETEVSCHAPDLESLLVAWLNELLFLSEVNDTLFTRFTTCIQTDCEPDIRLEARVTGSPGRGPMAHIKAVTFYDLTIRRSSRGWEATVTFDT